MDTLMGNICLVAALGSLLCNAAPVSDSLGVSSTSSVSVPQGHTTTLPCWLNPAHSAEGLEVRWYLVDFDFPVFLYRAKKFENASQDASYRDRVSFGLKDAVSGGLKAGDVSLKLENVMLEDAGDYTCYVSSDQGYDSASVSLAVTKMGNPPLLSFTWKDDNMVNVSCETGGWHPKPDLHWSDKNKVLPSKNTKYSKDSSGLLSVHSWLLVPTSSEVSCSVGLSGEEAKEARMRLGNPPQAESASSAGGWVAFTLLLIAVLAGLGVLYYKQRVKKAEPGSDITDGRKAEPGCDISEENNELLPKEVTDLKQYHVNVTLDNVGNPFVTIKDGTKIRDAGNINFPDGLKVTCLTAVKGNPGFSSGQHYWEVSLAKDRIGLKQSWWVGVTSADVISKDTSPTTSNGFWFLSSSPHRAEIFKFNTKPNVLIPVSSRPKTLGVYLNYDSGELSFYNVEDKSLIGSLTAHFSGQVFPFFNPGKGDKAPMQIIGKATQDECSDMENSPLLYDDSCENQSTR